MKVKARESERVSALHTLLPFHSFPVFLNYAIYGFDLLRPRYGSSTRCIAAKALKETSRAIHQRMRSRFVVDLSTGPKLIPERW